MSTSFVGFDALTASTDDPVAMLAACHTRVRKQCTTLRALLPHLKTKGADDEAAGAAHRVMRYFDEAAQHHHADEQEDLFPRLLKAASTDHQSTDQQAQVQALCNQLCAEHANMAQLWLTLRGYLIKVRSHQLPERQAMALLVAEFTQAYEAHTAFEDERLLPLAEKLLSKEALTSMSQQMKARRQQT